MVPMIIGIDGNEANVQSSVGTSVYTHELLHYFATQASDETQFIIYLREPRMKTLPKPSAYFSYRIVPAKKFWRDIYFPLYLYMHQEIDVLFSPAHYTPRYCPVPIVVAIHDLAYEYFPHEFLKKDLFKLRNWTQHAVKQARAIIAVSKSSRKDISKFYNIPKNKITTVYNGFKTYTEVAKKRSTAEVLNTYHVKKNDYILYVGTLQPRKNITTLIHSFEKLHRLRPHTHLIIAGKKGWLYDEFFTITQNLEISHIVHFPGFVPDEELVHLYKGAGVYVLPSLYEGFGIPVAEAMYLGCPVIVSHNSSLPEVGGDAALYIDPHNEKELTAALLKVMGNEPLRQKMIKAGKQQVAQFSMKKMASETLDVIKHAILNV